MFKERESSNHPSVLMEKTQKWSQKIGCRRISVQFINMPSTHEAVHYIIL